MVSIPFAVEYRRLPGIGYNAVGWNLFPRPYHVSEFCSIKLSLLTGSAMALLEILHFPDPRLRNQAVNVTKVTPEIERLVADLFQTMYHAKGIGLAATQVNVTKRVVVVDLGEGESQPLCLINPEILERHGEKVMEEGCLSVPGVSEQVTRAERIRLRALDRSGNPFELEATGLLAVCIQHELDHLDGKLFIDYLSGLKRQRIRKRLERERRSGSQAGAL